ncbi:MAG: hypothetical protein ACI85E_000488, partial [Marinomonas primoryensis]
FSQTLATVSLLAIAIKSRLLSLESHVVPPVKKINVICKISL